MIACVDINSAASTATYIGKSSSLQQVVMFAPVDVPPSFVRQLGELKSRGSTYTWVLVSSTNDAANRRLIKAVADATGEAGEKAQVSYSMAARLLDLLSNEPTPEITVEPTGEISFEWYKDRHHVAVLSVDAGENLRWAAMVGPGKPVSGAHVLIDQIAAEALAAVHAAI